jgi:hypothetical protein
MSVQWAVVRGGAAARDGNFGARWAVARAGHQAPGVAIALEASAAVGSVGIEMNFDGGVESANRDDVPGLSRHDISYQEIDLVGGVGLFAGGAVAVAGLDVITMFAFDRGLGGFDLHAPEAAAGIEDEVVRLDLPVRFGDAEAEFGGFVHEGKFGDVAAALAIVTFWSHPLAKSARRVGHPLIL